MDNDDVEGSVTTPTRCKGRDLALKHVSIVSEDSQTGKFKAQCNYCPSILTGDKKSTSNLLVHMKRSTLLKLRLSQLVVTLVLPRNLRVTRND